MTISASSTFDVDLLNPGQFFACCGLLELANAYFFNVKMLDAPLAWFGESQFHLSCDTTEMLESFYQCKIQPISDENSGEDDPEEKSGTILLADPFQIRLDWWSDLQCRRMGLKTWSGGQTVSGFFEGMRKAVVGATTRPGSLLLHRLRLRDPKPFYFDAGNSRNTALDVGFSTDAYKLDLFVSPATELLALIGLQRFRPYEIESRVRCGYMTWKEPLPIEIAAAVACGALPTLSETHFSCPLVNRTADARYKAFGRAQIT
jgi:CRISPR-associated protein Csb3